MAVQADPAVAGLGAAMVGLRPEDGRGGMRVRFEGEAGGRWAADLVLVRPGLPLYRVAIPLLEGRGEITVPLDGLREAVLLVRSLDSDSRLRRYSWSAVRDAAWPVEIGGVNADRDADSGAVALRWDTLSEAGTLGFNVVRRRADGAGAVRVNPVWVPAVGDRSSPAEYRFVDTTAEPGVAYVYRVEAVTAEGLTTLSEPVDVPAPR